MLESEHTLTWYHSDRLGSIRLLTDQAGAEVKGYDYKAFGDFQSQSGSEFNERTFTGHISDAETGLIYMGARYYDAALGRFISADTIVASLANPQSLNRYSYVYNNPVNSTDPTGHMVIDDGGGGCAKCKQPPKGNTSTNGSGNTTPASATSADDTDGDDENGYTPGGLANSGPLQTEPSGEYGFEWLCTAEGQFSTCSAESHTFAVKNDKYLVRMWITKTHLVDWQKPNASLLYFENVKMVKYLAIVRSQLQLPDSRYDPVAQYHETLGELSNTPGLDVIGTAIDSTAACVAAPTSCGEAIIAISISKTGGALPGGITAMEQTEKLIGLFDSIPAIYMTSYVDQTVMANPGAYSGPPFR